MSFEGGQDRYKLTITGSKVTGVNRLHSVILTPDGSHTATAQVAWKNSGGVWSYINLACAATSSAIFTPSKPVAIGGVDIECTFTVTASITVGVGGTSEGVWLPSRNLLSKVTVKAL